MPWTKEGVTRLKIPKHVSSLSMEEESLACPVMVSLSLTSFSSAQHVTEDERRPLLKEALIYGNQHTPH